MPPRKDHIPVSNSGRSVRSNTKKPRPITEKPMMFLFLDVIGSMSATCRRCLVGIKILSKQFRHEISKKTTVLRHMMAKNERIIAQDLAELRHAIQTKNAQDVENLCRILKREISRYPVKQDIVGRLESVANYHDSPDADLPSDVQIAEITNLIDILTLR